MTGTINVSGSSTVEPISTAVAELVKKANSGFNYTVTGPGTGDGFKTFCKGETDISDASRKIKDEEAATCKAAGIEYTELKIAYDGMTVMTSPDNTAVTCLSFADLYALTGPSRRASTSGRRRRTSRSHWARTPSSRTRTCRSPDRARSRAHTTASSNWPSPRSPTQADAAAARADPSRLRRESANDNAIIAGIAGSPSSLGWVGFAFAQENKDKVKEIGSPRTRTAPASSRPTRPSRRDLPAVAQPVPLRQQGQGGSQSGGRRLRRLLPGGRDDLEGPRDGPYVNLPADALAATRTTWEPNSHDRPPGPAGPHRGPAGSGFPARKERSATVRCHRGSRDEQRSTAARRQAVDCEDRRPAAQRRRHPPDPVRCRGRCRS